MSNPRYPEEFKTQAVNQVIEKKLPVADVVARLGVSTHSLYAWISRYSRPQEERQQDDDQHTELRRLHFLVTRQRFIASRGESSQTLECEQVYCVDFRDIRTMHQSAVKSQGRGKAVYITQAAKKRPQAFAIDPAPVIAIKVLAQLWFAGKNCIQSFEQH